MVRLEETIVFENYSRLFDFICEMDGEVKGGTLFESYLQFEGSNWRFVSYRADRVAAIFEFLPTINPNIEEAYEGRLGLLEICAGDYQDIRYIPITPKTDMEKLKKNWLRKYCKAHGFALAETFEEGQNFKPSAESASVAPCADILEAEGMGGVL